MPNGQMKLNLDYKIDSEDKSAPKKINFGNNGLGLNLNYKTTETKPFVPDSTVASQDTTKTAAAKPNIEPTTISQPKTTNKSGESLLSILSAPGGELNKAIASFGEAFTPKSDPRFTQRAEKGLAQFGTGLAQLANTGMNLVSIPFTAGNWLLKQLPGGKNVSKVLNYPFEMVAKGEMLGQHELDQLTKNLPEYVKNLGMDKKTADQFSNALRQTNQSLAQMILAGMLHSGTPKMKEILKMEPDKIKEVLDQRLKNTPVYLKNEGGRETPVSEPGTTFEAPQLQEPSSFYVNPEGVTEKTPEDITRLKNERIEIANQIPLLEKKIKMTDDAKAKGKLQKVLDDRVQRANNIDQTLYPGYEKVEPRSKVIPEKPLAEVVSQESGKPKVEVPKNASKAEKKAAENFSTPKDAEDHLIETPLHLLPDPIKNKMQNEANILLGEVEGAKKESQNARFQRENVGGGYESRKIQSGFTVSNFPEWFSELGSGKKDVIKALQKIIEDEGKDKGKLVEKVKATILDHLQNGREFKSDLVIQSGVKKPREVIGELPPDEQISNFLQQFADKKVSGEELNKAFEDYQKQHPELNKPEESGGFANQLEVEKQKLKDLIDDPFSDQSDIEKQQAIVSDLEQQGGFEQVQSSGIVAEPAATLEAPTEPKIDYTPKQIMSGDMPTPEAISEAQNLLGDSFSDKLNEFLDKPDNRSRVSGSNNPIRERAMLIEDFARRTLAAHLMGKSDIGGDIIGEANNFESMPPEIQKNVSQNIDDIAPPNQPPPEKGVKPGEQTSFANLAEPKSPEKPISGEGKGEETTPLFQEAPTKNKQREMFGSLRSTVPFVKEFIDNSVAPTTRNIIHGTVETVKALTHLFAPKWGVDKKTLDLVDSIFGDRNKAKYILDQATKDFRKLFDKMKRQDQVAFVDRMKRGLPQPSPELQRIADFLRQADDKMYEAKKAYKPNLPWLENHFRVLWKKIPGMEEEKGFKGIFKRPIRGSMGSLMHHTLNSMMEGIEKGGVPYSYNPITNFFNAWFDDYKFVSAQKMWDIAKENDLRRFIKTGSKIPDNFVKLNDAIAKVYFKSAEEGMKVSPGEWYVDEGFGRLLNNYLSRDLVRESALGKGLMWIKNSSTAMELALSPYHFVFESAEASGSSVGLGMRKIANRGVFSLNIPRTLEGVKDIVKGVTFGAAKLDYSLGKDALRYLSEDGFKDSPAGKKFIKNFPQANHLIDLGFKGGLIPKMAEDYKIGSIQKFKEALSAADPIGAYIIHGLPSLNEMVMKPLFDDYIPHLKWGVYMREIANELYEQAPRLEKGLTTEGEIARNVVASIENRFGEMNFDNLYWNRTLKSSLQLLLRSVTWKYGNLRAFGNAFFGQGKEFFDAYKEGRAPMLHRDFGWLVGMSVMTAAMSNAIQLLTMGEPTSSIKDLVAPRINKQGDRLTIATYWKDMVSMMHSPVKYVAHSTSGFIGRFIDLLNNRDFYGYEMYDPNAPITKKAFEMAWTQVPKPFWASQIFNSESQGLEKYTGLVGFPRAAKYLENTPAQNDISELYRLREGGGTKPYSQRAIDKAKRTLKDLKRKNDEEAYQNKFDEYVKQGLIDPTSRFVKNIDKTSSTPWDIRTFKGLPTIDQLHILKTYPKEMDKYLPYAHGDIFKLEPNFLILLQPLLKKMDPRKRVLLFRKIFKSTGQTINLP